MSAHSQAARQGRRLLFPFVIGLILLAVTGGRSADHLAAIDNCPGPGLLNPGFEEAASASDLVPCWDWVAPDSVSVRTTETIPSRTGTISVSPYIGSHMVRLGTPKLSNQAQARGENQVTQAFVSSSTTLRLAVRLFSWEHRGNDVFRIALQDAATNAPAGTLTPFTLRAGSRTVVSCSALPCVHTIDVGNSGDFLDSGWQVVTITNVPTDRPLRLTLGAGGTNNESTATWAYVDSGNSPPVADFRCLYARIHTGTAVGDPNTDPATTAGCRFDSAASGDGPVEGSPVQLSDLSTDPDGPQDIVRWEWFISGPGLGAGLNLRSQKPFFLPPQDGNFSVTLKVTDSGGLSSTRTRTLAVVNAPPLANAIDVEFLAGKPATVSGRFSDSGWTDQHTVTWDGLAAADEEDHSAALGSGRSVAELSLTAGPHTFTVSDGNASTSASFVATEVADTPASRLRHEPNDAFPNPSAPSSPAQQALVDAALLSFLQTPGDRDVFEVRWPGSAGGSTTLPAGAEILTTLRGLPADYDLVLVAVPDPSQTAGFSFSGYSFSGFSFSGFSFSDLPSLVNPFAAGYSFSGSDSAGFSFSPLERSSYAEAGFSFSGYSFSGFSFSGFSFSGYSFSGGDFAPYAMTGYSFSPISQQAFTGLESGAISSPDISAAELALGQLPTGAQVVGFSARRGMEEEVVVSRIDRAGMRLFAVVIGANGAHSEQPYTLQVEGSLSFTAAAISSGNTALLGGICPDNGISSDVPTTYTLGSGPASPKTLILTNLDRLRKLHPADAAWNRPNPNADPLLVQRLKEFAANGAVQGLIVDLAQVPGVQAAYQAWDALPCDVQRANTVTDAIRTLVAQYPSVETVVIAGDDMVVPFRRVPDETTISNERYYLGSSYLQPGTPQFASVKEGYNLTDDFYVDDLPTPWQGRLLYVPDRVIGRLVETPAKSQDRSRRSRTPIA